MPEFYKLEGNDVVPCDVVNLTDSNARTVLAQDMFFSDVFVSTVFLFLDHSFSPLPHDPVVFETMVFHGEHDQFQERYTSYDAAMAGHERVLKMIAKTDPSPIIDSFRRT